jgi:hypothetical protein
MMKLKILPDQVKITPRKRLTRDVKVLVEDHIINFVEAQKTPVTARPPSPAVWAKAESQQRRLL